jgi:hypothetical protein
VVAVGDAEAVGLALLAGELLAGELPELQAAASNPAPSATARVDHQACLVPVIGLMSLPS